MNFYLKRIMNTKTILLLIIIQSIIYLMSINTMVTLFNFKNDFITKYEQYMPIHNGGYIWGTSGAITTEKETNAKKDLINYIINNSMVDKSSYYTHNVLEDKNYFNTKDTTIFSNEINDLYKDTIQIVRISHSYYNAYIKSNLTGTGFIGDDFKDKSELRPVILGENLKKQYNIGDKIISKNNQYNLRVVGFLKKDILLRTNGNPVESITSLKNAFIIPFNNIDLLDSYLVDQALTHLNFRIKNNIHFNKFEDDLYKKMKELNIDYTVFNYETSFNTFLNQIDGAIKFQGFKISTYAILSLGILILSLLYLIKTNKKFLGILYAIGGKRKDMIKLLLIYIYIILSISLIWGNILGVYKSKFIIYVFLSHLTIKNLIISNLIFIVTFFISLIIPVYKLCKINPYELIGGFRE